jgi:hypothetical protein
LNVSGKIPRIIWKSGWQEALLLPSNSTMIWKTKELNWTATDWDLVDKSQTKEMSTAIGMLSLLSLLTTSDVTGSTLCLSTPTGKLGKYDLKPGAIIGGSWASYSHCNLKVDNNPGNSGHLGLSTLTYFQSDTSVFIMYPSFNLYNRIQVNTIVYDCSSNIATDHSANANT